MAKIRSYKGETLCFMDFNGAFSLINERKEDKLAFWKLDYEF